MTIQPAPFVTARPSSFPTSRGRAFYSSLYRAGFTPWDTGQVYAELLHIVAGPETIPPGRARDLGCGTGTHSVYLASRG